MSYLHWAEEQWIPSEEDKTVQAEYERILNSGGPFTDYRGGLCYADYVDVDGDGTVELLTVSLSDDWYHNKAIVTVYANIDGHAGKYCEGSIDFTHLLSICRSDTQPAFMHDTYGNIAETHEFYKIENRAFELDERIEIYYGGDALPEETDKAFETYEAFLQKFTAEKELIKRDYSSGIVSISDRGLVPSWEEYTKYWTNYWEASDPVYAAALCGDFSAFAGNYEGGCYGPSGEYEGEVSLAISEDGTVTGARHVHIVGDEGKTLAIWVRESGEIRVRTGYDEFVEYEYGYTIYPPGCAADLPVRDEPSKMRISYWIGSDGSFAFLTPVS
ncbi:MAG: hypothetical protein HDT37_06095 [Clostridiales bacterium]|nr:hypothetical protein [Clostridiales bacterium]